MQSLRAVRTLVRLVACGALFAAFACSSSVEPGPDADGAVRPDGGTLVDGAALPDGAVCRSGTARFGVNGPACGAQPELASPANATSGVGGTAYVLTGVRADGDRRTQGNCAQEPWMCGDDARVGFTAPEGGKWRVTATGAQLRTLGATRVCGSTEITDVLGGAAGSDYRGAFVATGPLAIDIMVQRGERVELVMDGCPPGTGCTYDVRADRIGDLGCVDGRAYAQVCGQREHCALDPCDPRGRFQCVPDRAPEFEYVRVYREAGQTSGRLIGRLRADADAPGAIVFWVWLDASGAPIGSPERRGGFGMVPGREVDQELDGISPDATSVRLELELGALPMVTRVVPIESFVARAAGEACDAASALTRCAAGLLCAPASPGASPTCVAPTTLQLTALTARHDAAARRLGLEIYGTSAGARVWRADVEVLDASGALIGREPMASVLGASAANPAGLIGRVELDPWTAPAGLARVRVRAIDTDSRTSAPVEAAVEPATLVGLGAPCVAPLRASLGCASGLACDTRSERCEPAPAARDCGLEPSSPTWAPPAQAGTYTIDGRTDRSNILACLITRSASDAPIEFVAPARGTYTFIATANRAMRRALQAGCGAAGSCSVAATPQPNTQLELTLDAGQRVPLTVGTADGDDSVRLEVRVPPPG